MRTLLAPVAACLGLLLLAACESESLVAPPPAPSAPLVPLRPGAGEVFNEHDFSWSRLPGGGAIQGVLTYRSPEGLRYLCRGRDVILIPETPWVRRRMFILYGSMTSAQVPADIVRARTPAASAGDYASYARKTVCDTANRFSFPNLPDGGWYVITLAHPADNSEATMAIMRRVETHGGPRSVVLN
ncbi:MAG TPA: hypothetical protein VG166_03610 [Caulobacteraceae bacterium]|jgi:hypothetical protein|nr:hypothetical protein [Caulobacteraceae bacterium]